MPAESISAPGMRKGNRGKAKGKRQKKNPEHSKFFHKDNLLFLFIVAWNEGERYRQNAEN